MDIILNKWIASIGVRKINQKYTMIMLSCLVVLTFYFVSTDPSLLLRLVPPLLQPERPVMDDFESVFKLAPNHITDASRKYASLLLDFYKHRLDLHKNASFIPKISDAHLFLQLRLPQFFFNIGGLQKVSQNYSRVLTLSIFCYEVSIASPICNISLTIVLNADGTINMYKYVVLPSLFTTSHMPGRFSNMQLYHDILKIHAPVYVSENKSYHFMFQICEDSSISCNFTKKSLEWPVWPLTNFCAKYYLRQIIRHINNTKYDSVFADPCFTANILNVSSPLEIFEAERSSISSWLDIQYRASSPALFDIQRRRKRHAFETVSEVATCPLPFKKWILDYQRWHADVNRQLSKPYTNISELRNRILQQNIRFLFCVHFDSGIADRFAHLVSTYLVAILTGRFFVFDDSWLDLYASMQVSLASREENISSWITDIPFINRNLSRDHKEHISQRLAIFRNERILQEFDYDKDFPERILFFKSHIGNVIHTLTSTTSIYRQFLETNLTITSSNIYGCLYHSLLIPRLSTLVHFASPTNVSSPNEIHDYHFQNILQILFSPRYYPVGVQIRIGDHVMIDSSSTSLPIAHWINGSFLSNFGVFFACANKLIRKYYNNRNGEVPIVFLISDSYIVRRQAISTWPFDENYSKKSFDKKFMMITSSKPAGHITYTQNSLLVFQQAVLESFFFSTCEEYIITTNSGFGRFAAFAGMKNRDIYSLEVGEQSLCTSITLREAGHEYSGI